MKNKALCFNGLFPWIENMKVHTSTLETPIAQILQFSDMRRFSLVTLPTPTRARYILLWRTTITIIWNPHEIPLYWSFWWITKTKYLGKDLRYITREKACTGPYKITFTENVSANAYMNEEFIGNKHVWLNHLMDLQDAHTHRNDLTLLTFIVPFSFNCSLPPFN